MSEQPKKKIGYENNASRNLNKTLDSPFLTISPAKVYLDSLGDGSRRTMTEALSKIAGIFWSDEQDRNGNPLTDPLGFSWHTLDRANITELRAALDTRYAHATANKMLAALRGTLREAWRLGLLEAEAMHRLTDIKSIPGNNLPAGRALTTAEIRILFHVCAQDHRPQGTRDAAIFGLLIGCGLRRAEICLLDLADCSPSADLLTVRGKRNKQRTAYLQTGVQAALMDWLEIRENAPGPLFYPINKSGKITPVRIREQAIYKILRRRAEAGQVRNPSVNILGFSQLNGFLQGEAVFFSNKPGIASRL